MSSPYTGEIPDTARAPQAQLPTQHPMQQTWAANQARATQNAYSLEDAIVDRIEYTRQQELEAQQKQLNSDLKIALDRALSLANGAPGSLFDKDGTPNATAIKNFANPYTARLASWNKGFITPQSRQEAAYAQQNARTAIQNTVSATVAASLKPRALAAFKQNYELSIAQGDTLGATNAAKELHARGYASDAELALYTINAQEQGVNYKIKNLGSLNEAISLSRDSDFLANATPAQINELHKTIDGMRKEVKPSTVIPKRGAKEGSTNTKDYIKTAPLPPAGLTSDYIQLWQSCNGDFKSNPQARQYAASNLVSFIRRTIPVNEPYSTEYEASLRKQMAAFTLTEGEISAALKEVRSCLSSGLDFQKSIQNIPANAILPMYSDRWLESTMRKFDSMEEYQYYTGESGKDITERNNEIKTKRYNDAYYLYLERYLSKEDADAFRASGLSAEDYQHAQVEAIRACIETEYSAWLSAGNNMRVNDEEKLLQLSNICNKYIIEEGTADTVKQKNKERAAIYKSFLQPYVNMAMRSKLEIKANKQKIQNEQNQEAEKLEIFNRRSNAETQAALTEADPGTINQFSVGYFNPESEQQADSTEANIIYVPEGFGQLGNVDAAQLVGMYDGEETTVYIREGKVQHPTLSNCLAGELGLMNETSPFSIAIYNGKLFLISPNTQFQEEKESFVAPENYLFPGTDDGLVPMEDYEYSEEEAAPMNTAPLPIA